MTRTLHFTAQHNYCSLKEAKVLRYFTYLSKMHLTSVLESYLLCRSPERFLETGPRTKISFWLILSSPKWNK